MLLFEGPVVWEALKQSVIRALQADGVSLTNDLPSLRCEWVTVGGIPNANEAALPYVLNRMGTILQRTGHEYVEREGHLRALLHRYSRECSILTMFANFNGSTKLHLAGMARQLTEAYAEELGTTIEPAAIGSVEYVCARQSLFAAGPPAPALMAEFVDIASLVTAVCCVLVLTASGRPAVDVCLPRGSGADEIIVPINVVRPDYYAAYIQEILDDVRSQLNRSELRSTGMLHSHAGCVVARENAASEAFTCGDVRVASIPIQHFGDWDMKVSINWRRLELAIDSGFSPRSIAKLMVHVWRCVLERPSARVIDIPLV